jgi:nicotinamidase/pyrazinamidase
MNPMFMNSNDALLLVDVQRDFCPGGALPVEGGSDVVAVLNRWIDAARQCGARIVASRDWHPPDHISFRDHGGRWPQHCIQDSEGAEFHPDLKIPEEAEIVSKGLRSDADNSSAFDRTPLADKLRHGGVHRVFLGGLAQDVCVRQTALDARRSGFEVHLITDATRPFSAQDGERALREMQQAGVFVDTTNGSETA